MQCSHMHMVLQVIQGFDSTCALMKDGTTVTDGIITQSGFCLEAVFPSLKSQTKKKRDTSSGIRPLLEPRNHGRIVSSLCKRFFFFFLFFSFFKDLTPVNKLLLCIQRVSFHLKFCLSGRKPDDAPYQIISATWTDAHISNAGIRGMRVTSAHTYTNTHSCAQRHP